MTVEWNVSKLVRQEILQDVNTSAAEQANSVLKRYKVQFRAIQDAGTRSFFLQEVIDMRNLHSGEMKKCKRGRPA